MCVWDVCAVGGGHGCLVLPPGGVDVADDAGYWDSCLRSVNTLDAPRSYGWLFIKNVHS